MEKQEHLLPSLREDRNYSKNKDNMKNGSFSTHNAFSFKFRWQNQSMSINNKGSVTACSFARNETANKKESADNPFPSSF